MESTISNHSRRWNLLPFLCLATLSSKLSINIVLTALLNISEAFPNTRNIAEWTLLSYSLTAASLAICAGYWGDRYGLRRMFGIGLQLFLVGSVIAAFSPTGSWLVGTRVLAGMGSAIMAPVSLAFVNRLFSVSERPLAFGYWSASISIGTVLGPILGGGIQAIGSWRMIFPIAAIPALVALIYLHKLPEYNPAIRKDKTDTRELFALTFLPFILLLTLTEISHFPIYITISLLVIAIITGVLTFRHLLVSKESIIPMQILCKREWWIPSLLQLITRCVFMASLTLMTLYLQVIRGLSAFDASLLLIPFCLSVGVTSFNSGRLCKLLGTKRLINIVYGIGIAGLILLLPIGLNGFTYSNWLGIIAIGVMVGNTAQLSRLSLSCFPKEKSMVAASLNTLIINLGLSVGAVLQISFSTIAADRLNRIAGWPLLEHTKQLLPSPNQLKSLAEGSEKILSEWLFDLRTIVINTLQWEILTLFILTVLSLWLTYRLFSGVKTQSSLRLPVHE